MIRFAVALAGAIVGGAIFGVAATFFQGMIPSGPTRWAFYFFFGIPAWIAAEIFGEALYALIVPSAIREKGKLIGIVYLVFIFSIVFISAFLTSQRIGS